MAIALAALATLLLAVSFALGGSANPALLSLSRGLREPGWFVLLAGIVAGALAFALRPRRADAPASVEPDWFPNSTEFARSTVMPPQEPDTPARGGAAPTAWGAQVFDDLAWQRVEALAAGLSEGTPILTPQALVSIRENGLSPLERDRLLALIAKRSPDQQQALLARAYDGEYWRPTCASCGQKMVSRSARKGGKDFWGCADFPRCRSTLPMRASG